MTSCVVQYVLRKNKSAQAIQTVTPRSRRVLVRAMGFWQRGYGHAGTGLASRDRKWSDLGGGAGISGGKIGTGNWRLLGWRGVVVVQARWCGCKSGAEAAFLVNACLWSNRCCVFKCAPSAASEPTRPCSCGWLDGDSACWSPKTAVSSVSDMVSCRWSLARCLLLSTESSIVIYLLWFQWVSSWAALYCSESTAESPRGGADGW